MKEGSVFPPIRVWYDGDYYWISDGFHRLAACELAGQTEIKCEVRHGSLDDARWDSYAANSTHGLNWSAAERQRIIQRALEHANAKLLSNVEIARHIGLPEATVRRWRHKLLGSGDHRRLVTRGQTTYSLITTNLGKGGKQRSKSLRDLQKELLSMKERVPPNLRRLLVVIQHWAFGSATSRDFVDALSRILQSQIAQADSRWSAMETPRVRGLSAQSQSGVQQPVK